MRTKNRTIAILFLLSLVCLTITNKIGITQTSFKGVELYSWKPTSGVWHFSLLMGTNRTRTIEEITDPKVTIVGADNLKKKFSELPKGEYVYWLNHAKEPVPRKLAKNLSDYCNTIGINLYMKNI